MKFQEGSWPWLHAMGTMSYTLHLKVKYPTRGQVGELVGSQAVVRQCLVAAIRQHSLDKALVGDCSLKNWREL